MLSRRHEYSKKWGSRVNERSPKHRAAAWMGRPTFYESRAVAHWPGRVRVPTVRARTTVASGSSALARTANAGSGLGGSDVPTEIEHGGARAGSAQLTYRDVSASGGLRPITDALPPHYAAQTSPHAPRPISVKVCANTNLRINYSRCYLKIFVCDAKHSEPAGCERSRRGVAHTNCCPAAGRLMRAGRFGAGNSSATHAHVASRPSLWTVLAVGGSRTTAPHYHNADSWTPINRGVGTKYSFDLHFTHTSERVDLDINHTCARACELLAAAPRVCYFW